MAVVEDKGQKKGMHEAKHRWFCSQSIQLLQAPLPVGDYILATDAVLDVISRKTKRGVELKKMDFLGSYRICVDTKKDIQEIIGNICGKSHSRFRDEAILAKNNNIKLYVLIENEDGIKCIGDLYQWENPRLKRYSKILEMHQDGKRLNIPLPKAKPTSGETLAKAMLTMQLKYDAGFLFCRPGEAGDCILRLLAGGDAKCPTG